LEYIGAGGMQEVYRAEDLAFNRQVALKAPKNLSASKRFDRSAVVSAKITHPNVARTFDFIPGETTAYLVEELVDGVDLQQRLNDEFEVLDVHLAAHLFQHICKGVQACHKVEVVHRDLKPSNIMVSRDPSLRVVKITDFGIAKMAAAEIDAAVDEGDDSITASATVVGALPYMAPEVFTDEYQLDLPADVWSLGALLYHLTVGERPFGSGIRAIAKIGTGIYPAPETVIHPKPQFRDLFNDLSVIIKRCLVLNPADRPTAEELVGIVDQICYSTAERFVGTICNYGIQHRSWGFIQTAGREEDAFFHADSYYRNNPANGHRVSYAAFAGDPRSRAFPVLRLK